MNSEEKPLRGPGRPRDEDVRTRILESAVHILEDVGFRGATIEGIAEHAGASRATLYRWWPNKAAILIEAFREAVAQELPFPNVGSFAEDVRSQLQRFAAMLTGRRGRIFAAFLAAAQTDPEAAEAFRTMWIAPRRAEAKRALARHRQSGELDTDVDLDLAIDMMYAPLYYRALTGYGALSKNYVDALADAVLHGLRGRS